MATFEQCLRAYEAQEPDDEEYDYDECEEFDEPGDDEDDLESERRMWAGCDGVGGY